MFWDILIYVSGVWSIHLPDCSRPLILASAPKEVIAKELGCLLYLCINHPDKQTAHDSAYASEFHSPSFYNYT